MTYENINLGTLPNDGTGDPLRVAFTKINNNFASVNNLTVGSGVNGSLQFINVSNVGNTQIKTFVGNENLVFDSTNNLLKVGATIVPLTANSVDIGTSTKPFGDIYSNTLQIGNSVIRTVDGVLDVGGANVLFESAISYGNVVTVTNFTTQSITITTEPNQILYELPLTDFTSATLEIESRVESSQYTQKVTLAIVRKNDASDVSYTASNTIFLGDAVTKYDVNVNSGNVEVGVSPLITGIIIHNINLRITR